MRKLMTIDDYIPSEERMRETARERRPYALKMIPTKISQSGDAYLLQYIGRLVVCRQVLYINFFFASPSFIVTQKCTRKTGYLVSSNNQQTHTSDNNNNNK